MTDDQRKSYIAALLRERAGAEQYGKADTVREIDAELVKIGHKSAPPVERAERMTRPAAEFGGEDRPRRGPGRPKKQPERKE